MTTTELDKELGIIKFNGAVYKTDYWFGCENCFTICAYEYAYLLAKHLKRVDFTELENLTNAHFSNFEKKCLSQLIEKEIVVEEDFNQLNFDFMYKMYLPSILV